MTHSLSALSDSNIGFIGAGNMAKAIIKGLLDKGLRSSQIKASAKTDSSRKQIEKDYNISCSSNRDISKNCDTIILSVKPQILKSVCLEIAPELNSKSLVISVAAGISCSTLESWLGKRALIRCMPNTPSSIGLGAAGLFANSLVNSPQKETAKAILSAVGIAEFVKEESNIDAVTAIAGSAPAYFFLFLEAMIASGTDLGLDAETAKKLAVQTALGASKLAQSSTSSIEDLRNMVTSPKGTTEQAILSFQDNNLHGIVDQAMKACVNRAQELSRELSSDT